ncbi:MAG: hypothetical protein A3D31_02200 [Candidatus Fluviicola riflensis]|nr:MAG: hypothetical protein CHH17_12840 [Candidatus Fluviicola riflensis]OGS78807.1 MAG: hypothetical protein A3D31_02200 [Candidatus Fluviicola riflensis]OGS85829.1 MAG: hypothetical protein A3E30_09685 [Fluviicola sp. RIFCSPHIGHO2_12_FULL_43_24]OGS86238.1 MAG: hypothetical protein A2724_01655 [Fluviicola sp. RIFCSPHIGHO2_01_FULL_43_53]
MNVITYDEAEVIVQMAIRNLEEQQVHKHLIARFILKLTDQIVLKKKVCEEYQMRLILDQLISFLRQSLRACILP